MTETTTAYIGDQKVQVYITELQTSGSGGSGSVSATVEEYTGSDATGASGALNRVLTLSNSSVTSNEMVFIGGVLVAPSKYTMNNLASNSTITFSGVNLLNGHQIIVRYHS